MLKARQSVANPTDEVQNERKHYAEQDRSREGKIERGVLAAIDDVAGQAAEGNTGTAEQDDDDASNDDDPAQKNQQFSKISHGFILTD